MIEISVIIPTYNPDTGRLDQTIQGLKEQTFPVKQWELIIVDNNSSSSFAGDIDISWHPNSRILGEPRQGLTYARSKGFSEAKGAVIIMVDDDNILNRDHLEQVSTIFKRHPSLGAIGGRSLPLFEHEPPEWLKEFYGSLALRDLGDDIIIQKWENKYPAASPIGAGMAIKKEALASYIAKISSKKNAITDRTANSLSSGGDNDIIIEVTRSGWEVGYFPSLVLTHIIPKERMQAKYLAKLMNNTNRSWIQVLESHHINPWGKIRKWTLPLRKVKAWFAHKAWKNKVNYIRWQAACGTFDGLAL